MEKFTHQQFLDDNKIDLDILPTMLKKRILGFQELKADLEHTTDEDKEHLSNQLERLSHELAEDLEEHFEDELENNDEEEEEVKMIEPEEKTQENTLLESQEDSLDEESKTIASPEEKTQGEIVQLQDTNTNEESTKEPVADEEILEKVSNKSDEVTLPEEQLTEQNIPELQAINSEVQAIKDNTDNMVDMELTDEGLLDQLFEGKMYSVLPDHLIEMGFKTRLNARNVRVGKYLLHKGKYDKRYTIHLKK